MNYDYNIIVIGAGSAGLVVASGAINLGARVALIEGENMGGDCLNTGCVPSKSFLRSAHLSDSIHRSKDFGIDVSTVSVDIQNVMDRVSQVIKSIEPHDSKERYESLGVKVYKGYGKFIDAHTISIGNQQITGKHIVIATGSNPLIPSIKGIETVAYYTNRTIFSMKEMPKHLVVLGAGPIGCELGQGFAHLGSKVTMIDMMSEIFAKDEPEVRPVMLERFHKDGIVTELGARIIEVRQVSKGIEVEIESNAIIKTVQGDALLVALGRKPNTEDLGIENTGITLGPKGHVLTNAKLQSSISNIYACGDVTGPYPFTHTAGYQGSLVIRNTMLPIKGKVNYRALPWVTYTKPEVAHVGAQEAQLIKNKQHYRKYIRPLIDNDRAKTDSDSEGFLKILTTKSGVVIGATMVGEKAGEQIGLANIAIVKKLKLSSFLSMIFPYPTELEIYQAIALEALKDSFKPWQKRMVKRLFFRD